MPKHDQTLPTGNLQLPNKTWVDVNQLRDSEYRDALGIGIAKLIEDGKLILSDIKAKPPLGRRRKVS